MRGIDYLLFYEGMFVPNVKESRRLCFMRRLDIVGHNIIHSPREIGVSFVRGKVTVAKI